MKTLITDYTFTVSTSRVTFSAFTTLELDRILLITNVSTGQIIFNFADPAKQGSVNTNFLTLTTSLVGMTDTDDLQIYYDLDGYKLLTETVGTITYMGKAIPGIATSEAKWQIKEITKTSTDASILWAGGTFNFSKIWDDRASLSYS